MSCDVLIQARSERSLIQHKTTVGILLDAYPSWYWQVGSLGQVKWMKSRKNLPGRLDDDPPWFPSDTSSLSLPEVEVVLVQGLWPETTESLWSMKSLKVAIGITKAQQGKRNRKLQS